jgi:hypothetical protein
VILQLRKKMPKNKFLIKLMDELKEMVDERQALTGVRDRTVEEKEKRLARIARLNELIPEHRKKCDVLWAEEDKKGE